MIVDSHTHVYPDNVARVIASRFEQMRAIAAGQLPTPGDGESPLPGVPLPGAGVPFTPPLAPPVTSSASPNPLFTEHPQLSQLPMAGTLPTTVAAMDRTGIERAWMLPVATNPKRVVETNDWVFETCAANPRFVPFATLHARDPGWREELARAVTAGARGVKLHVAMQLQEDSEHLVSDEMSTIFEALQTADLTLVTCTFFPKEIGSGQPGVSLRLLEVLDNFPRLRVVAAHMGAMFNWAGGSEPLFGSRAYLDLAFVPGLVEPNELVRMIRKHGPERVLFGSDAPYADPQFVLDGFEQLSLNDDEREAILWKNAAGALGESG